MKKMIVVIITVIWLSLQSVAFAADTTETFDPGASDFEFYLNFDGLGKAKYERSVSGEALVGLGIIDGFSGYLAAGGESNEYFSEGSGGLSLGLFGTPVDTDHFDLDLFIDVSFSSEEFGVTPALEMNFDLDPDMASWGVYLRVEEGLAGRDESVEDDPATANIDESETKHALAPSTGLTAGTYFTVADGHQLLAEYDMAIANNPEAGEDTVEIGGVALGYNVQLSDYCEMANQVYFDIPASGEDFSVGIGTGFIFAIPVDNEPETEPEVVALAEIHAPQESSGYSELLSEGLIRLETSQENARFSRTHIVQDGDELVIYGKVSSDAVCNYHCHVDVTITDPKGAMLIEVKLPYTDRGKRLKGWAGAGYRARLPLVVPHGSIVKLTFSDKPRFSEESEEAPKQTKQVAEVAYPENLLDQAKLMLRLDDYNQFEKAEVDFLALRYKDPTNAEVTGWLAQLYVAWAEQIGQEIAFLLKKKTASELVKKTEDVTAFSALLSHRMTKQAYVKASAKELADVIVKQHPDSYIGHRVLADYYRLDGDKAKMEAELTEAKRLNPGSVGVLFVQAAALAQFDKNYDAAIALYDVVLKKDPMFVKAEFFKALALREKKLTEQADAALASVLEKSPTHPGAQLVQGYDAYMEQLSEEAKGLVE